MNLSEFRLRSTLSHKLTIITLALLAAIAVGVLVPTLTYASAPLQENPATPDALAAALLALAGLFIAFVMGGGLSYFLDMIPQWKNWQSAVKGYIVIALSIAIGAALTSAKVFATPDALSQLPEWARAGLGFIVVAITALFGSQLTYQKFSAWK